MEREIEARVRAGERLGRADGVALFAWDDLVRLGRLAHLVRTARHGDRTTFTTRAEATATPFAYGLGESPEERVDALLRLRGVQDADGGIMVVAPVTSGPAPDAGGRDAEGPLVTPAETLATLAVARLLLDNVPHLSCAWPVHGLSLAQLSLNFGVDDLGGLPADAGSTPAEATSEELAELIWDAGFVPVERDLGFGTVREYGPPRTQAERRAEPQAIWS